MSISVPPRSMIGTVDTSPAPEPVVPTELHRIVRQSVQSQFDADASFERQLERAVRVAQSMFGVDVVRLTLVDAVIEWHRDATAAAVSRDALDDDFWPAAGRGSDLTLVADASEDPLLYDLPEVVGPNGIRFFAFMPIRDATGTRVGGLRLLDSHPRVLTEPEQFILRELVAQVEKEIGLRQELEQVAIVQRSLAPRPIAGLTGYEVAGLCAPARAVGGDFYDWYLTRDGGVAFTLADVMGKGIGAAIVAATVRGATRSGVRNGRIGPTFDAASAALDTDVDGAPAFVTMFHGRLDLASGEVRYVDAGHGLSMVVRAEDRSSTRLHGPDLPLGVQPEGEWTEQSFVLHPGDTLVSISDGVLDFFEGSLIALEEVEAIVLEAESADAAAREIVRRAGESSTDDVTALVIRRSAP